MFRNTPKQHGVHAARLATGVPSTVTRTEARGFSPEFLLRGRNRSSITGRRVRLTQGWLVSSTSRCPTHASAKVIAELE
jgi:hypothetical protein